MVLLALREGQIPWIVVISMPIPSLVAACREITKAMYREQYEWVWANFVSSQCDNKAMKQFTKPWKKAAGIR